MIAETGADITPGEAGMIPHPEYIIPVIRQNTVPKNRNTGLYFMNSILIFKLLT